MALYSNENVEKGFSTTKPKSRIKWLDIAKGGSIFMVVLYHVTLFTLDSGFEVGPLEQFNTSVGPIRMPLFFLVSGLFSASLIKRDWQVVLTGRFWNLTYLFFLWSLLFWLFQNFVLSELRDIDPFNISRLLLTWIDPFSSLWFLWALALYTLITKATYGHKVYSASIAAVTFYLSFDFQDQLSFSQASFLRYILFFQIGVWFRDKIFYVMEHHVWYCAGLGLIYFPIGFGLAHVEYEVSSYAIMRLTMSLAGVFLVLCICRAIELSNVLSIPFIWLGQRTLPIYVLHLMLAWLIILPISTVPAFRETIPGYILAFVVSVLVAIASVALQAFLNRAGLLRLFSAPALLMGRRIAVRT